MPLRYRVALVAACLLAVGGLALGSYLRRSTAELLRQSLKEAADAGAAPLQLDGTNLESDPLEGMGIRLPRNMDLRIKLADWLTGLWLFWVPLVFALSFAAAYLCGVVFRHDTAD
jgi:hypothetical protein